MPIFRCWVDQFNLYCNRRMEPRQNKPHSKPLPKKLPFLQTLSHLHEHNKHVYEVCLSNNSKQTLVHENLKQHYLKDTAMKQEERTTAMEVAQAKKRKSLEKRRKEQQRRSKENLQKLERVLAQRRQQIAKKGQKLMEESSVRKEQYQTKQRHFLTSLHQSTDQLSRLKLRQEAELGYSLILLQQNQEKLNAANDRKMEAMQESRSIRRKNQLQGSAILSKSIEKQAKRQQSELQKILQKYSAAQKRISSLAILTDKSAEAKRTQLEKSLQKHRKRRSKLKQSHEKSVEAEVKADLDKLVKADSARQQNLETQLQQMQKKREKREKSFMSNSLYLQVEADRKVNTLLQRHHEIFMGLTSSKVQRQLIRCSNLQGSFRATLRS